MKTRKLLSLTAAVAALLAGGTFSALAQINSVGVNFVNNGSAGVVDTNSDSLLPAEIAGAPAYAQANWNNLGQFGDSVTNGVILTNSAGAATSLFINWHSPGTFVNTDVTGLATPDGRMMGGGLFRGWTDPFNAGPVSNTVYGTRQEDKPLVYVSGLNSWVAAEGAEGYVIVTYTSAGGAWWDTCEHWIQSVSGDPLAGTMVAGDDLTPHIWTLNNGVFNGIYKQAPASNTNGNTVGAESFVVSGGLTNDAVLIRTYTTINWGQAALDGFQIVPVFPAKPTAADPTFAPSSTVYAGVPVTLTEVATGDAVHPQLWYQWCQDKNSDFVVTNTIVDATNSTYSFTPANAASPYTISFDVIVTNIFGASTSSVVTLTVNPAVAPYVTTDTTPTNNLYVFANGSGSFSAAFDGPPPITYQWQADTGAGYASLSDATNTTVTLTNVQSSDGGNYRLMAHNAYGDTPSTPSVLTVLDDPAAPDVSQAYAYAVMGYNPYAYWRFSETIDSTASGISMQAYDYSGHNFNGTYGSQAYDMQYGPSSSSAPVSPGFEDTNACVAVLNSTDGSWLDVPSLNLNTNAVTITAWIKPTGAIGSYWGLFMWRGANGDAAGLGFGGTVSNNMAELGYTWNTNSSSTYDFHSGLFAPFDQWSFVALTITPTNSTLYLYYTDGYSVTNLSKVVQSITNSPEAFSGGTIRIGSDNFSGRNFNGALDEVAVFNQSLSEAQIQNLFSAGSGIVSVAPYITKDISSSPANASNLFPGQVPISLIAAGSGMPAPGYQWQAGSGGVFTNLSDAGSFSNVNSGTLTINPVTPATYLDYRLVLANINGSATSSVYHVSQPFVPTNGLWTARFQVTPTQWGQAAASGSFTGLGVLGSGTYWNAVSAYGWGGSGTFSSATRYQDNGSTDSGITCTMQGSSNASSGPYATNDVRGLLSQVIGVTGTDYTTNSIVFANIPNGYYNMAFHGACGGWNDRGATFRVHGMNGDQTAGTINGPQFTLFENYNTTVLFTNVEVTNGILNVDVAPTPIVPNHNPNTEGYYNGVEVQLVSYLPPTAGFSASTTNVYVGQWFAFNDKSSGVTNVVWDFGDGNVSTNVNGTVYHGYYTTGTYTVSQTVTGPGGTNSVTKTAYITVVAQPTIGNVAMEGGSLVLSGSGGIEGAQYRILNSTNVALPLSSWTPVETNVFGAGGSYSYTNSTPTNNASFYIMVTP